MTAPFVRIYLCTYRRHDLLPRALKSLLGQKLTNWVCELHNDAPDDPFPAKLAAETGDPRITVVTHQKNLGGVGTFNLMFGRHAERYISLLEDDNWWDPDFLETMVEAMDSHPEASVAWSNMRFWQEESDGRWLETGDLVWPAGERAGVELFRWPDYRQAWRSLHSTGAMLVRTGELDAYRIPPGTRFDFADPVRERAMPHPILLVSRPLVNFALTRRTSRGTSLEGLMDHYTLLMASFFRHVNPSDRMIGDMWGELRRSKLRATNILVGAGVFAPECRRLLKFASFGEWLGFLLGQLRRPGLFLKGFRFRRTHAELWKYLDDNTRKRCADAGEPRRN